MNFLEKFSGLKVLIVGDIMLDRYWWGSVSRISPEAPVPIVNLEKTSVAAGGAANVALNVKGLGATPLLAGLIGADAESKFIGEILREQEISDEFIVSSDERPTTVKTRIIAHSQQVARIDQELKTNLSAAEEKKLWGKIEIALARADAVIISDYGKGVITENLAKRLITSATASGQTILVDPKGKNYAKYKNGTMLTPNRFEIAEACGLEETSQSSLEQAGLNLLAELNLESLLITQGEDGMTLIEKNKSPVHLSAESRNVYDVTGAGDTVIACLAVTTAHKKDFVEAAKFANKSAGLVVEHLGTTAITLKMLAEAKSQFKNFGR